MENGPLTSAVDLQVLTPASSVQPVEERSSAQDPESKTRRRSRSTKDLDTAGEAAEFDEAPSHQLDRLA